VSRFDTFLVNLSREVINPIIKVLFGLAIAYFLYGVTKFLINQDDEEARTEGRRHMIWGIIGIFIMMAVFGIMNLLLATMNIPKDQVDPETNNVNLPDYNPSYPQFGQ
jgi:hypothetical protein